MQNFSILAHTNKCDWLIDFVEYIIWLDCKSKSKPKLFTKFKSKSKSYCVVFYWKWYVTNWNSKNLRILFFWGLFDKTMFFNHKEKFSPAYINKKILWHNCEGLTNVLWQVLELLNYIEECMTSPVAIKLQFSPDKNIVILRTCKPVKFVFLSPGITFYHLNYEL